jgi:hypothetical protein
MVSEQFALDEQLELGASLCLFGGHRQQIAQTQLPKTTEEAHRTNRGRRAPGGRKRLRELTAIELQAVSGGFQRRPPPVVNVRRIIIAILERLSRF